MPRRRLRNHHHWHGELPAELYSEIISYLWNDIPSLRACSLANRIMTVPSQKHLFRCIALRAPLQKLRNQHEIFTNVLCGTSYNFWQMLLRSPHIAKYVVSLHIVDHRDHYKSNLVVQSMATRSSVPSTVDEAVDDGLQYRGYKLENGRAVDLDAPLAPVTVCCKNRLELPRVQLPHRRLPKDKFLPLCKPFLHNLKALAVDYDLPWCHLSGRVFITLLNLMQLPSLRYLQFNCRYRPDVIIDRAIGGNVKHLVLDGRREKETLRLPHPPLAQVYLDSLSISSKGFPSVSPACRVQISKLRKLVVRGSDNYHVAIWSLLQSCSATLQDFEICPSYKCKSYTLEFMSLFNSGTFSYARCLCQ